MKKIKNKKGFTLIELLAAVVILGILMLVAIPRVSKYIEDSRKNAFVDTAKAYVQAARYKILNGEINCESGQSVLFSALPDVDKGEKSSYGKTIDTANSFVKFEIVDSKYVYSVYMQEGNGGNHFIGDSSTKAAGVVKEDDLDKGNVQTGTPSITIPSGNSLCS